MLSIIFTIIVFQLNKMKLFWELTKRAFQRKLSYRAATIAGLSTNFFFGILRAAVLVALYNGRAEVDGLSLIGVVTFTAITQAVLDFLAVFRWGDLADSVYSGAVSSDLLKPMNYYAYWLAQDLGRAMASLLTRSLTLMLAYALFVGITIPQSGFQWAALIISIGLSWLLSFSWRFITNLISFWTPNAFGIISFLNLMVLALSGILMPFHFFPEWFLKVVYLTPFPHMVTTMTNIYLGLLTPLQMVTGLLWQVFWIAILFLIGQVVLRAGMRKLVILGG